MTHENYQKAIELLSKLENILVDEAELDWASNGEYHVGIGPMRFKGDIIIIDPCFFRNSVYKQDEVIWKNHEFYRIFTRYLWDYTKTGDGEFNVFNTSNYKKIGSFCVDSASAGIFLLKEVLDYNPHPNVDYVKEGVVIKNFDGVVKFNYRCSPFIKDQIIVDGFEGTGNKNFFCEYPDIL